MHCTYTGAAAKGQAQTFTSLLGLYLVGCSDLAVLQLDSNLLTISSARAEACVLSRDVQGAWEGELQATRTTETYCRVPVMAKCGQCEHHGLQDGNSINQ